MSFATIHKMSLQAEWQNTFASFVVGTIFILDAFLRDASCYGQIELYHALRSIMPMVVWGVILVLTAIVHLLAAIFRYHWIRRHVLLLQATFWVFLGTGVLHADILWVGGWLYLILAATALRSYFKTR
jgi:hypothetical protein